MATFETKTMNFEHKAAAADVDVDMTPASLDSKSETKTESDVIQGLDVGSDGDDIIYLVSSDKDKVEFPISKRAARMSAVVNDLLETTLPEDGKYPVAVEASALELVCKYLIHHNGVEGQIIERPLRSKKMSELCKDPFDANLVDVVNKRIYALILAANYLDIKSLLYLGCAKTASIMKGQPMDKIKGLLLPHIHWDEANSKPHDVVA